MATKLKLWVSHSNSLFAAYFNLGTSSKKATHGSFFALNTHILKILANGCSYTFGAGFSRKERESVIYPVLVGQHFDAEVNNVGWPASSNLEIFLRTLREMQSTHYDLIIVQWTTLQRHWFEPELNQRYMTLARTQHLP